MALVIAATWILSFVSVFFDQTLSDPSIRRDEFLGWMLDELLGHSTPLTGERLPQASGLEFVPERLHLLALALPLLFAAAVLGHFVLAQLRLRIPMLRSEGVVLQLGTGLSVLSLIILIVGQLGLLNPIAIFIPVVVLGLISAANHWRHLRGSRPAAADNFNAGVPTARRWVVVVALAVVVPFAVYLIVGAMTPPTDFDVREYHLQGPKEWFQQERITFLPHNVYTSFPFLSEMLSLGGMVVADDWWTGALVGQVVLVCFQLLSGLCAFAITRRWFGREASWWAGLIYLTTPWTLRISLNAYAEGALAFYLTAAAMTVLLLRHTQDSHNRTRLCVLTGILAGSAMASKYTGLVSAVIPIGILLVASAARSWPGFQAALASEPIGACRSGTRQLLRESLTYAAFAGAVMAPWLLRNLCDTGNPVYPLGYSIFGGDEWSPEMDARWKPAHAPAEHHLSRIPEHFLDAAVRNKWTSGLLFALAVPAMLLWRRVGVAPALVGLIAWQFIAWWALTHRIDRFWIPVIPLMAVAAASSWTLSKSRTWRMLLAGVILFCTVYNIRFSMTPLVGFHAGLTELAAARDLVIRADLKILNRELPQGSRVLMVGDAEVFDATFPLIYNTVFDESLFEQLTASPEESTVPAKSRRMKPAREILTAFRQQGITHVVVHWGEILRYRQPGSYGYTEFVQPSRFVQLVSEGVLQPPVSLMERSLREVSESDRAIIRSWDGGDSLTNDNRSFSVVRLYRVNY